jgi:hypothetical protein
VCAFADRDRKKLEELFAVVGSARAMSAGAEKESRETTASLESDVALYSIGFILT